MEIYLTMLVFQPGFLIFLWIRILDGLYIIRSTDVDPAFAII